ncbi:MAG: DNA repair protein [Bacillota bacterium]|jgi:DNA polymerase V
MAERTYLCIDLKSFYASVECVDRGLDPMTAHLVVADPERSEGTICLAVSPALKALGVPNRCRVFQIPKDIPYIMAPPRMRRYIECSAEIYGVYLRWLAPEDIHVYSIDEAFLDVTHYLKLYRKTPKEMALTLMGAISEHVGVRSTCGIGTNLYLAKIALDILAKHAPDFIGELDEESYREKLWEHQPLTDFWRIGRGVAGRLKSHGIRTMGQIARADEEVLYRLFGIDAELLIDHAWGREPTTIADIKAYQPKSNCLTSGQVLMSDYDFDSGKLVFREMVDQICLDMVAKNVVTDSLSVYIGYARQYRAAPAKGTVTLPFKTNGDSVVIPAAMDLYDRVVDPRREIRRLNLCCNNIMPDDGVRQPSLFDDGPDDEKLRRNHELQKTVIDLKDRFGKNTILKAMDLTEGATAMERNNQIGGHKSGEKT